MYILQVKLQKREFQIPQQSSEISLKNVSKLVSLFPKGRITVDHFDPSTYPVIDYTSYLRNETPVLRRDLLAVSYLSKAKFLNGLSPRQAAVDSFIASERMCHDTNLYLRSLASGRINDSSLNAVLFTAQRKIAKILGRFSYDSAFNRCTWGPGSTSSCKGAKVSNSEKFAAKPHVTAQCSSVARQYLNNAPSWSALLSGSDFDAPVSPMLEVIKGSRVTFVPKNAKTHRAICVEPHLNVFLQAGIGRLLRQRLLSAGLDLSDQTLNQRLAERGSLDGSLATIDLKAASDTISREIVKQLLPWDWFEAMDKTRSHSGSFDGREYFLFEKFSSMGNGFTFDLESLLFWSIALSVAELHGINPFWINVFGDDIVVPTEMVSEFSEVIRKCGFEVNVNKSFSTGPFRESCGSDFFHGDAVRSVFLKELPRTPTDWIKVANQIRLLAHQWAGGRGCCRTLETAYRFAVSQVPRDFRFKIPKGYGDGGLIVNFDEAAPSLAGDLRRYSGWEGYLFTHLVTKAVTYKSKDRSLITSGVFKPGQAGNELAFRERVVLKKVTSIAPSWDDLGAWI